MLKIKRGFYERDDLAEGKRLFPLRAVVKQAHDRKPTQPGILRAIPFLQHGVYLLRRGLQDAGVNAREPVGVGPVIYACRPFYQTRPMLREVALSFLQLEP